jgi:hypothetical protein
MGGRFVALPHMDAANPERGLISDKSRKLFEA